MIHFEELTVPDGVSEAVDSARRGLGAIDRDSIGDAASSAARSVLPERWFRPKPRRWPFVVVALLLLAMVASVFLLRMPMLTSKPTDESADEPKSGAPDPAAADLEGADLSRLLEIEVDPEKGLSSRAFSN